MNEVFYVAGFDPLKRQFFGFTSFDNWLDYMDSAPNSKLEEELCMGSFHDGPGLATVINLDIQDPNGDKEYLEMLEFWSKRGCPQLAISYFSHYDPAEWNETNDSLVRSSEEMKKSRENYSQLLLGFSLV